MTGHRAGKVMGWRGSQSGSRGAEGTTGLKKNTRPWRMLGLDDHVVSLDQRTGEKGLGLLTLVSVPTPYPKARTLGEADKAHGQS